MKTFESIKEGSQNYRLLEALKRGPVYTQQRYQDPGLRFGYLSRRIKDLKCHLEPQGLTIQKTKISAKDYEYCIVEFKKEIKRTPLSILREWFRRFFIASPVPSGTMGGQPRQGVLDV